MVALSALGTACGAVLAGLGAAGWGAARYPSSSRFGTWGRSVLIIIAGAVALIASAVVVSDRYSRVGADNLVVAIAAVAAAMLTAVTAVALASAL